MHSFFLLATAAFAFAASGTPVQAKRENAGDACYPMGFSYTGNDGQCWTCDFTGHLTGPNTDESICAYPAIFLEKKGIDVAKRDAERIEVQKRTQAGDHCDFMTQGGVYGWFDDDFNCWVCTVYDQIDGPMPGSACGLIFG